MLTLKTKEKHFANKYLRFKIVLPVKETVIVVSLQDIPGAVVVHLQDASV